MTKQGTTNSQDARPPAGGAGAPGSPLGCGLVLGVVGDRGIAIYPGQSAEDVLKVAKIIQRELDDVQYYSALDLAREIIRALADGARG